MKKYIIIFTLFFGFTLDAKDILEDFLVASFKNPNLGYIQSQQEIISSSEFDKTFIDKIRVSANYSNFDKDDIDDSYEIRVYPKSFSKIDIEEKIYNSTKEQMSISYEESKLEALKVHFLILLEVLLQKESYKNIENMLEFDKNRLRVLLNLADTTQKIIDISKLKQKIKDREFNLMIEKERYTNMLLSIKRSVPTAELQEINQAFEKISLITIVELANLVNKNRDDFTNSINLSVKNEKNLIKLAQSKIELTKIENSIRINSLDLEYEDKNKLTKSLSVGISLEYTWAKNRGVEDINNNLRLIKAQSEFFNKKERITNKVSTLIDDINFLKSKLIYTQDSIDKDHFYQTFSEIKNSDPLMLLDLQQRHLRAKENIIRLRHSIYSRYIELLFITKKLTEKTLFKK